eukprot:CAMPEP_0184492498 /NCGR_PEP_ID=MMETSP0113_2-20130426/23460_1 /TAXON_ID=91329 /ORGANISM="Norrisiella sphaerica, Strain BC52" /LENGTH=32 /DNA_ID= /DNA_START= /DNA_END= /DNA_ORIENTATION=
MASSDPESLPMIENANPRFIARSHPPDNEAFK